MASKRLLNGYSTLATGGLLRAAKDAKEVEGRLGDQGEDYRDTHSVGWNVVIAGSINGNTDILRLR